MTLEVDSPQPRLDAFLASRLKEHSRSRLQTLVKEGHILVNDRRAKPKQALNPGDLISVTIPEPVALELVPQDIPLAILHEDEDLIVLNKAHGMVVHPANGNQDGTLVNALLHHCNGQLAGINGVERPGIVHRLDKDTSGCIVAAKTDRAMKSLLTQFAERETTTKIYYAVTSRPPLKEADTIFTNIGRHPVNRQQMAVVDPGSGKAAITDYEVQARHEDGTCLVKCTLHTGRTHQIRVHLKHVGAPILSDPIYGRSSKGLPDPGRLMLHARVLAFTHPATGQELRCEAPFPAQYQPWLDSSTREG
ncbi:RluA family pseudouridine synthase [Roseibacillus ishigakijimensis]|uniref:Pseudouridine synthase n=1 Tax=Roseibacillus ishigakijimensis TaxID=454146 RepID=A0A934VLB1_9BACT|nr:RluA family pseudouridine synthase [Roseibacillus ishigakijimensis]MBK1832700.1 RluA family pseudouridine synthase [Roseibacillus ishigakijimensis]